MSSSLGLQSLLPSCSNLHFLTFPLFPILFLPFSHTFSIPFLLTFSRHYLPLTFPIHDTSLSCSAVPTERTYYVSHVITTYQTRFPMPAELLAITLPHHNK
ncbi:hypothetical protein F5Y06DRAFT_47919 [Hypoxylon sp. FL0890]|nr:hypothetical protein F5Y06DRAFT_47919 [Hypoxylon sp. FL0890]